MKLGMTELRHLSLNCFYNGFILSDLILLFLIGIVPLGLIRLMDTVDLPNCLSAD